LSFITVSGADAAGKKNLKKMENDGNIEYLTTAF